MKQSTRFLLYLLPCLLAAPLGAQVTIGGGSCSSNSLSGTYLMTLTGRQISSTGAYQAVIQGDGSITFDGLSKVTLTLTSNTLTGAGTALNWAGTYTVQANCQGTVTIATGDTATFSLLIYNSGSDFLLAGTDATYNMTASGSLQSVNACTLAKLAGVYSVNATGFTLSGVAVNGIGDGVGLIQFDGKGSATLNFFLSTSGGSTSTLSATGTYTLASTCLGTVTLSDTKGNSYSIALAATGASGVAITALDVLFAQSGKFTMLGAGHPLYGQPTALLIAPPAFKKTDRGFVLSGERA